MVVFCVQTASTTNETPAQTEKAPSSTTVTPLDPKDSEARQELARAEALRANWTEESFRQAIDHYDKAALLWTSISDFANASDATLKSGDVYFLLSEFGQALKRYQNAKALAEKMGGWLVQARALSQIGRLQSYLGNNDLAQRQLTKALHLFRQHEANRTVIATNAYGEALSNLAEVSYSKGDFLNSSKQLETALKVFQNDRKREARVHLFNGYITGSIGETDKAVVEITRALELYREINDKSGEGLALTAKGLWHSSRKDESRAIKLHNEAIEIFRAIGDRHSEAIALHALGQAYKNLSEYSNALSYLKSALEIFQHIGALDAAAGTALSIALAQHQSGDLDQALTYYELCLRLSRSAGNRRTEAYALNEIAMIYGAQGRHKLALKQYQNLQKFYKSIGDLRGQATAFIRHGDFLLKLGQKQKALDLYRQALPLSWTITDKEILISTLYNLARANKDLGANESALPLIKQSCELIEDVRAKVGTPEFRASYFSTVRKHYDLYIEILMELERWRPGQGFATEAFLVSEKGRARLLLDLLDESRANIRAGAATEFVEHERRLKGLIQAQAQYQMTLSLSGKDSTEIAEVADQIAELRSKYQTVQAELRVRNPRLFSFEQFAAVQLERIQKALQDNDTLLLEYALGENRSYLWAVTSDSLQAYELPSRKSIEDASRQFYKLITARQGMDGQINKDYQANVEAADTLLAEKASNLSRMLLGPVAEQLRNRRLIVVTEGALQLIPFEALPLPVTQMPGPIGLEGMSRDYLLETNEVVAFPSISTLIAMRNARKHTSSPGKLVAVIADPVFTSNDDRVQSEALPSTVALVATDKNPNQSLPQIPGPLTVDSGLARLAHASEEADAISAVAPWGTTLVVKGFDANRETVMRSDLGQYQILHFATHSFLDSEHPELSGIVLTMVDRNGVRTDGLMPLPDIYSLDLSAELIVLSACQTALGKDMKGEGFVGLTHSFMSAGAKSVVASLWKVDDTATAALMADFYESMLQKGMTPAAALRSAKLKMMRDKRWSAPYYWAGFVLQGEYANRVTVDNTSWLRPWSVVLFSLILSAAGLLFFQRRKRRLSPAQPS